MSLPNSGMLTPTLKRLINAFAFFLSNFWHSHCQLLLHMPCSDIKLILPTKKKSRKNQWILRPILLLVHWEKLIWTWKSLRSLVIFHFQNFKCKDKSEFCCFVHLNWKCIFFIQMIYKKFHISFLIRWQFSNFILLLNHYLLGRNVWTTVDVRSETLFKIYFLSVWFLLEHHFWSMTSCLSSEKKEDWLVGWFFLSLVEWMVLLMVGVVTKRVVLVALTHVTLP